MTIFLIRHGRTLANEQHLYCGSTDLPLSRAGREVLANRPPIDVGTAHFITSGMRRCNETLAILFGDVPYEVVRDFREIDFGAFEMKSYEMLKDEPAYQTWLSRDPEINPPTAASLPRSWPAFSRRKGRTATSGSQSRERGTP